MANANSFRSRLCAQPWERAGGIQVVAESNWSAFEWRFRPYARQRTFVRACVQLALASVASLLRKEAASSTLVMWLWLISPASGQLAELRAFRDVSSEGAWPSAPVVIDGRIYGTTFRPGDGEGAVYSSNVDGTDHRILAYVPEVVGGARLAPMIRHGDSLFDVASGGGNVAGAVFKVNIESGEYESLGSLPLGEVSLYGLKANSHSLYGTLYKTTENAEIVSARIFEMPFDGAEPMPLSFQGLPDVPLRLVSATEEALFAFASVDDRETELYRLDPENGTATLLHQFEVGTRGPYPTGTLTDLSVAGNTLYGGVWEVVEPGHTRSSVFSIDMDGGSFQLVHDFGDAYDSSRWIAPNQPLVVGDVLFGSSESGGAASSGLLFRVNLDGSNFQVIHEFSRQESNTPRGSLAFSDGQLFGKTMYGPPAQPGEATAYGSLYSFSVAMPVAGDVNGDGTVDLTDFGILKTHFGAMGSRSEGDVNGDGSIDLSDFGVVKANFGRSTVVSVPEPGAFAICVSAFVVIAIYRLRCDRGINESGSRCGTSSRGIDGVPPASLSTDFPISGYHERSNC